MIALLIGVAALLLIYWVFSIKKTSPPSIQTSDFDSQMKEMRSKIIEEDNWLDLDDEIKSEEIVYRSPDEWGDTDPFRIIIDVETSGLRKFRNPDPKNLSNWPRIVQIAYQVFDKNDRELDRVSVIFKQPRPLPAESIAIHKITDQMCKELGVKPEPILQKLYEYSKQCCYMVAHNVEFDHSVIEANMRRFKIADDFGMQKLCTMAAARKLKGFRPLNVNGKKKDGNLAELYTHLFGKAPEVLHDAEADMLATSRCFFELKKQGLIE